MQKSRPKAASRRSRKLRAAARAGQVLGVDPSSARAWAANPLKDLLCSRRIRKGRRVVFVRRHDDRLARGGLQTCVSARSDGDHAVLGGSNGLNILRCSSSSGARFTPPLVSCWEGSCRIRLDDFCDASAALRSSQNCFRNFGADRVILVRRQRHSSQDTNDRHNDHQFDKGKAGLCAAGDLANVHEKNSRLVCRAREPARSEVPSAASVPPGFPPLD